AHPAPAFFGNRTIVSNDPELGGAAGYAASNRQKTLDTLVLPKQTAAQEALLAQELSHQNIAYVVLSNDFDYKKYRYLDTAPGLTKLATYPTLTLYKNTAWRQP
ncbi:MAG TPA: hypothetical protein VLF43_04480, partial [Candidatus Saccharimonadales bacterium]|nr:hypothetical protein [Candidatus Saccharimonadales bacterium]